MTTPHPAGTSRPPFDDDSTRWYHRPFSTPSTIAGSFATLLVSVVVGIAAWWLIDSASHEGVRLGAPASVLAGEPFTVGADIASDWLCTLTVTYADNARQEAPPGEWSGGSRFWEVAVPLDAPAGGADIAMSCTLGEKTQVGSTTVAVVSAPE